MFALFAIAQARRGYSSRSGENYITGQVITKRGLNVRDSPEKGYNNKIGVLRDSELITIVSKLQGWYKIKFNNRYGYVCSDYVDILSDSSYYGISSSWPPKSPIRQKSAGFNSNIQNHGCGFMCCCWIAHKNSISECNNMYDLAIRRHAISTNCYIKDWNAMKKVMGAKKVRFSGRNSRPRKNEREMLKCMRNSKVHYVVGDGNNRIEYDPVCDHYVEYNDHVSKIFFLY